MEIKFNDVMEFLNNVIKKGVKIATIDSVDNGYTITINKNNNNITIFIYNKIIQIKMSCYNVDSYNTYYNDIYIKNLTDEEVVQLVAKFYEIKRIADGQARNFFKDFLKEPDKGITINDLDCEDE